MTLGTRLFTWLRGREVGSDHLGNRYYMERKAGPGDRSRRWVVYNGAAEATRVPPEWHAWLHHTVAAVPAAGAGQPHRAWQKEHLPNQTGTETAYRPPGHVLQGGRRARATGDYEPWRPN
ncbi:NADH:ubiquinone oxidoreductase subunit [Stella humosa]|uniref:NADH:ubiquinone oxidoreductase subunit n=1 Tax=Stella humosa TaxID=94 RepID=A0A3N1MBE2_9PROT|nr:NADH:ubiquinone oxidoreductase subunit NDUFA12 [Stella humosa]ROQ00017.1 NADH:ubiquinone oxidoreductase subunit [Stella humosa]BBK30751.1 NADH dehydrogenase [Stella humosa]